MSSRNLSANVAEDAGFPPPTGDPSVLPAGARLERLFDGGCRIVEGPAVSPDDGMVYFSDITFTALCKDPSGKYLAAGNIWRWDPKTRQATIFRSPSGMSNGMHFDAEGNLWITGFRSSFLTRVRPDGTQAPKVETPAGSITQVRFGGSDMRDYFINSVPSDGGDSLKDGVALTAGEPSMASNARPKNSFFITEMPPRTGSTPRSRR